MASPDSILHESEPRGGLPQVSAYDKTASMVLALLILLGSTVLFMLIAWLSAYYFAGQAAVPVVMEEIGTGDEPMGGGSELETPTMEEVAQDFYEPELKDTLSTITTAVTDKAPLLDDPAINETAKRGGMGTGKGRGVGSGTGTGTGRGRRWEVRFPKDNTLEDYARQLDFFGIELGVIMPDNKVEYAFNLSKAKPDRRTGAADKEKRYYLSWRQGELEEADRDLLGRAEIASKGKLILKFLPPAVEGTLAQLEKARAGDDVNRIRVTRFAIRSEGDGYTFYVIEQSYK